MFEKMRFRKLLVAWTMTSAYLAKLDKNETLSRAQTIPMRQHPPAAATHKRYDNIRLTIFTA